jgi:hypothetical protein
MKNPCYTEFHKEQGNLVITLTPSGRKFIKESKKNGVNTDSDDFLHELLEWQTCNGWNWVLPEDIGALTSAPILSETFKDDNGESIRVIDRVYAFMDYQVLSPVQEMIDNVLGRITFIGYALD